MRDQHLDMLTTKERFLRLGGITLLAVFATLLMLAMQAVI